MSIKGDRLPECGRKFERAFAWMHPPGASAPGALVLRLATAATALILTGGDTDRSALSVLLWGLCALLLILGFLTRAAALAVLLLTLLIWRAPDRALEDAAIIGGLGAAALFLSGGGAWSIDAYLFGRRVITLQD